MAATAVERRVTLNWGDGVHSFLLPIGQLRELQEKTGAGPQALIRRLTSGDWLVDDLRETIRLGLIGGGMAPKDAHRLVVRYVDERPLGESYEPALAVLVGVVSGFPVEAEAPKKPGKRKAAKTSSTSPPSMAPAPSSASPLEPSMA